MITEKNCRTLEVAPLHRIDDALVRGAGAV
jgi:hypothetical protein